MADIQVKCDGCGNSITVSEFVDTNSIVCRSCGEKVRKPAESEPEKAAEAKKPIGLKNVKPAAPAFQQPEPEPEASTKKNKKPRRHKVKEENAEQVHVNQHLWAWALFVFLGVIMGALRYGDLQLPQMKGTVEWFTNISTAYAAYIFIALQIVILLKAFKDSVFQGMLALLIPGYSLYYIFSESDDFFLRAVVAGILVGFGQDCSLWAYEVSGDIYQSITEWLASGG